MTQAILAAALTTIAYWLLTDDDRPPENTGAHWGLAGKQGLTDPMPRCGRSKGETRMAQKQWTPADLYEGGDGVWIRDVDGQMVKSVYKDGVEMSRRVWPDAFENHAVETKHET